MDTDIETTDQQTGLHHIASTEPSMMDGFMFMLENPADPAAENIDVIPETSVPESAPTSETRMPQEWVVMIEDLKKRVGLLEEQVMKNNKMPEEHMITSDHEVPYVSAITKADYSQAIHPPIKQEAPPVSPAPVQPKAQSLPSFAPSNEMPSQQPELQPVETPPVAPSQSTVAESAADTSNTPAPEQISQPELTPRETATESVTPVESDNPVPDTKSWQDIIRAQLRNRKAA